MSNSDMAQANYPYLDLTVLPEIRSHVIVPHAALLFDTDLDGVLWANGEGGKLIGSPALRSALDGSFNANAGMMRQIRAAVEKLDTVEIASAAMRVRTGFKTRLLAFTVRKITLPKGEDAVLLVTDSLHGRSHTRDDMAETAVNSLDGYTHASAIVSHLGHITAASEHFEELEVTTGDLVELVSEVTTEDDRLVKRPFKTKKGMLPAGIARISEDASTHILIIAEAVEDDAVAGQEAPEASSDVVAAGTLSGPDTADAEAKNAARTNGQTENQADEAPAVGAFSNKRGPKGPGRWYYKDTSKGPDVLETAETPDNGSTDEPAGEQPNAASLASGGLVQEIDHTPLASSEKVKAFDAEPLESDVPTTDVQTKTQERAERGAADDFDDMDGSDDGFRFTAGSKPVRFVWEMSADNEFRSVSNEFADAVGPLSADVEGLTWSEAASLRKIENADEIEKLLNTGDTWSGKTVLWPVENTDLRVPIDLAGLPSYGRNRVFEGFNGFGIIRTADTVVDPDATGLNLTREDSDIEGDLSADISGDAASEKTGSDEKITSNTSIGFLGKAKSSIGSTAAAPSSTGFQGETDAETQEDARAEDASEDTQSPSATPTRELSSDEKETFQEIGERLTGDDEKPDVKEPEDGKSADFVPSAFTVQPKPAAIEKTDAPKTAQKAAAKNLRVVAGKSGETAKAGSKSNIRVIKSSPTVAADTGKETVDPTASDASDSSDKKIRTPEHDVDTSILSRLPIPVLVYRDDDLLFGNSEFFKLTGYQNLSALADAGGVDALFGATTEITENSQASIYHKNGSKLDVHAHLQRVPWDDDRAMLLTLRRGPANDDGEGGGNTSASTPIGGSTDGGPESTGGETSDQQHDDRPQASITPLHGRNARADENQGLDEEREAEKSHLAFGGLEAEDLRSILDTATDGVIILSDEGIVRAVNKSAEALFDLDSRDMVDQNFTRLLAPESHRSALDYVSGMTGTGVASILNDGREVIGRTAKGGLIPLFMTIGKLQKTDACCAVMRDITQWKRAEEELVTAKSQAEAASAQKTDFLAKVSHEIRTPLNAIIGFSDLMIEERFGKIDNDRYRGYLRDIHRSGNHVLELVNDLLDISKIESGKIDLEFDACDLNTTVSETVALTQPDANKERIIIRTSLSAVVPKVVADPRSLRQIVLNLVSNSIKFTKSGGQVIVSTVYEESGEVVLRVRDTGIGMSELELAKAMKPFQQVGGTSDTGKQGTGLGLPLTKAMVEANRAQFHIESKPDEGTLVEIHFPNQRVLADR